MLIADNDSSDGGILERPASGSGRRTSGGLRAVAPTSHQPVLVVEDDEINQFAASEVLRKLGYVVEIAHNGCEAIEMTGRKDYAAVFMDCQMPELDGYAAAAAIRRRETGARHTPIIAVTAHAMVGDREKCLAAGMDNYITKPLRIHCVVEVFARVPDSQRAPPPLHVGAAPLFDPTPMFETATTDQATELIGQFLDQLLACVSRLADAIALGDREAIRSIAHTLKGSAACVGAPAIVEACDAISGVARIADLDRAPELHLQLAETATTTSAAMAAYVAQLSSRRADAG